MFYMLQTFNKPIMLLARFNEWIDIVTKKFIDHHYDPIRALFQFLDDQIKRRVKSEEIDENMEPRDLVDAFLIEKAKQTRLNLPTAELYS